MRIPFHLQKKIVNFLSSLPNIHDIDNQRALIYQSGLDQELQNQIPFGKPPAQFIPLLVSTLLKYGYLRDGRNAIEAVLEAAKNYVGQDKKTDCQNLIQELYADVNKKTLNPFKQKKGRIKIFLSYVKEDKEQVRHLYQMLQSEGFLPWMAPDDILPGQDWKLAVRQAIQEADFFVACLSENAVSKKSFFSTEINEALNLWQRRKRNNIYLLPVRLNDCEVPSLLNDLHWANFFEENGWERLRTSIQRGAERKRKSSISHFTYRMLTLAISAITILTIAYNYDNITLFFKKSVWSQNSQDDINVILQQIGEFHHIQFRNSAYVNADQFTSPGSCNNTVFPYNAQGEVDWPYIVKVMEQETAVYQDMDSSAVISILPFSKSINISNVQGHRVLIREIETGNIIGWVERSDLLCSLLPLKSEMGLEQKVFINPSATIRDKNDSTVDAYSSSELQRKSEPIRKLSRFAGYFIFDRKNGRYLLTETYKIDDVTQLVGWVDKENLITWDTAYGVRPKEDLFFPKDHELAGQEKAVCLYASLEDALVRKNCQPILGGERWYLSAQRIPVLDIITQGKQRFYQVIVSLPGILGEYIDHEKIKITHTNFLC